MTSQDMTAVIDRLPGHHLVDRAAGHRILGPGEEADVRRVVEIANRNEWSAEGDRLARALATDTDDEK